MNKKVKDLLTVVLGVLWMLLLISLVFFALSSSEKKANQAVEYLSQFEKSEDIAYVDEKYIHTKDKKIEIEKEDLLKDSEVLFASGDSIFFAKSPEKGFFEVYKTDYECKAITKIFEAYSSSIYMASENIILYYSDNEYGFIYTIEDGKLTQYSIEDIYAMVNFSEYYSYEIENVGIWLTSRDNFHITNKRTNVTKTIDKEDMTELLKNEQARYLDDLFGIDFYEVNIVGDKIYVQCVSGYFDIIVTTYLYDFENETFEYVSWADIFDIELYFTCYD